MVPSPAHSNRHGVVVFFRVFDGQGSSKLIGLPAPGTALTLASVWPNRYSLHLPSRQECDLLCDPLLKFDSPSRYLPRLRSPTLAGEHLSWGFFALQRSQPPESTPVPVVQLIRPFPAGNLLVLPIPPATVPFTGFLNLSTAYSFGDPSVVFRQMTLMGFSLQGFHPLAKAADSSPATPFMTFFPQAALSPS